LAFQLPLALASGKFNNKQAALAKQKIKKSIILTALAKLG